MVIVRGEKLVVFLLGNLVAVGLPVDDGGHPVLSFFRSGFHGNPAYLGSMPADLIRQLQAVAIGFRLPVRLCVFLVMPCGQFLVHFRMEADGDMLVTVQIIQGHFIREISGNDPVQELQTLLNGMLFKRIRQ